MAAVKGLWERKHIAVKLPLDFAAFVPSAFSIVFAPCVLILFFSALRPPFDRCRCVRGLLRVACAAARFSCVSLTGTLYFCG
jgi:hypothetical protein